ncbi:hypothetical protein Hanom_Chr03g00277351 [Helianthus anomalus]
MTFSPNVICKLRIRSRIIVILRQQVLLIRLFACRFCSSRRFSMCLLTDFSESHSRKGSNSANSNRISLNYMKCHMRDTTLKHIVDF